MNNTWMFIFEYVSDFSVIFFLQQPDQMVFAVFSNHKIIIWTPFPIKEQLILESIK